ncbi:MAG: M23 family metallopeptidase [Ferruginibacter sp.]
MIKRVALLIFFLNGVTHIFSQSFRPLNYPQQYFQWPVGAVPALVANFGELRPNHYHMGLDCRTNQKENLPVYAAAEGYIARLKIEPFGFGRCIYINHPNGYTTLYAHLNAFYPALEKHVTEQQYKQQKWNISLDIPAGLLPVTKGQFIAASGNTGGSQGPHLHFEIRNTANDNVLNPLLFGFPIADNIPPDIIRLAVYDRCRSTYEQTPKIFSLHKTNGVYSPAGGKIIVNTDKVSFAITSYDRYTSSTNQNGIFQAMVYDDDKFASGFRLNDISYLETRYLNAHIDYKTKSNGGPYLQHLSRLPGYPLPVYNTDVNNGVIKLEPGETHAIKINVSDANGNLSTVKFNLVLDKIIDNNSNTGTGIQQEFHPGYINIFERENINFYLPENALYDSFSFRYNQISNNSGMPVYQLHNPSVPVHTYFDVKIKANIPFAYQDKVVMKRFFGSKDDYVKAEPIKMGKEAGWYKATFREFGNFQLMIDSIPPVVSPVGFGNGTNAARLSRIIFTVKDNTEVIKKFTAMLDGKWLRFSNDKGRNFIYNFDEYCSKGPHELLISVEDQAGNVTEKKYSFTR